MTTTVCYSDGTGRDLYSNNATFATARSGSSVNAGGWGDADRSYCGQRTGYYVVEAFESIDTSAIPDTDTISDAVLNMWLVANNVNADFTINVYAKDYGATLDAGDWVDGGSPGTLVATLAVTSGTPTGQYHAFTNVGGGIKSVIDKTGDTRLVFISSKTVAGTAPSVVEEVGFQNGTYTGTSHDPYITVTHAAAGGGSLAKNRTATAGVFGGA